MTDTITPIITDPIPAVGIKNSIWRLWTPSDADTVLSAILSMIHDATRSIRVCAYGFTDPDITDALLERHAAGIDVELLLDYTQACGPSEIAQVAKLHAAGLPFWVGTSEQNHAIRHTKCIVCDGRFVIDGSYNFSVSARSQDNSIVIEENVEVAQATIARFNTGKAFVLDKEAHMQTDYLLKLPQSAPAPAVTVSAPPGTTVTVVTSQAETAQTE